MGVLGMDILLDTIASLADSVKIYDSGFAFLMDRDGNVLYHPEMEISTSHARLDESLSRDALRRRNSGDTPLRYTRNGEIWLLAFSAMNNNFKAAVTAPLSEITAYRRQLTGIIVLVALLILAAFTALTVLIVNRLTSPLIRLTSASERLCSLTSTTMGLPAGATLGCVVLGKSRYAHSKWPCPRRKSMTSLWTLPPLL